MRWVEAKAAWTEMAEVIGKGAEVIIVYRYFTK